MEYSICRGGGGSGRVIFHMFSATHQHVKNSICFLQILFESIQKILTVNDHYFIRIISVLGKAEASAYLSVQSSSSVKIQPSGNKSYFISYMYAKIM